MPLLSRPIHPSVISLDRDDPLLSHPDSRQGSSLPPNQLGLSGYLDHGLDGGQYAASPAFDGLASLDSQPGSAYNLISSTTVPVPTRNRFLSSRSTATVNQTSSSIHSLNRFSRSTAPNQSLRASGSRIDTSQLPASTPPPQNFQSEASGSPDPDTQALGHLKILELCTENESLRRKVSHLQGQVQTLEYVFFFTTYTLLTNVSATPARISSEVSAPHWMRPETTSIGLLTSSTQTLLDWLPEPGLVQSLRTRSKLTTCILTSGNSAHGAQ